MGVYLFNGIAHSEAASDRLCPLGLAIVDQTPARQNPDSCINISPLASTHKAVELRCINIPRPRTHKGVKAVELRHG